MCLLNTKRTFVNLLAGQVIFALTFISNSLAAKTPPHNNSHSVNKNKLATLYRSEKRKKTIKGGLRTC